MLATAITYSQAENIVNATEYKYVSDYKLYIIVLPKANRAIYYIVLYLKIKKILWSLHALKVGDGLRRGTQNLPSAVTSVVSQLSVLYRRSLAVAGSAALICNTNSPDEVMLMRGRGWETEQEIIMVAVVGLFIFQNLICNTEDL